MSGRNERQYQVGLWIEKTFGIELARDEHERTARFVEEAVELAQAAQFDKEDLLRIVERVYAKPIGEPYKEAGGVAVTLLGLANALGFSADFAERDEVARVLAIDPVAFRARHNEKAAAGIAIPTTIE